MMRRKAAGRLIAGALPCEPGGLGRALGSAQGSLAWRMNLLLVLLVLLIIGLIFISRPGGGP